MGEDGEAVLELAAVVTEVEERLRAAGTPERAEGERRYLKSSLAHLGATLPQMHAETKRLTHEVTTHDDLVAVVTALWAPPIHDLRSCAVFLLSARVSLLDPADLPLLERLVREAKTWALVDVLAGDVLGKLLVSHPEMAYELEPWAADPDFWVRRSALLSQLAPLRAGASFDRFGRWADAMLDEREFFIRKAIGWVLREIARRDPGFTAEWTRNHVSGMSGVTFREAVRRLPAEEAERLRSLRNLPACAGSSLGPRAYHS